jgi:hypothetical protein
LLRAVDGHGLGIRGETAHPELELGSLLHGALGQSAGGGHLAADQERERIRRCIPEDRNGRLELPKSERHRSGRVGGDQERVVDAVRHVRLDRRRPAGSHLLHRLQNLHGRQEREGRGDLRGSQT